MSMLGGGYELSMLGGGGKAVGGVSSERTSDRLAGCEELIRTCTVGLLPCKASAVPSH